MPTGITAGQPPYATTSQRQSTRRGEFWINSPDRVFVARCGRHELTPIVLAGEEVRDLVERMLQSSGRRLDLSQPFVDAMLPGGHRLHVVLEGISRDFLAVNIRKFVARAHSLDDLVALGTLNAQAAGFLHASVVAGLNIVVCGGTQAGKTTLLNCLGAAIPGADRVVSCEEVFELPEARHRRRRGAVEDKCGRTEPADARLQQIEAHKGA